jgi:hypothetical protein
VVIDTNGFEVARGPANHSNPSIVNGTGKFLVVWSVFQYPVVSRATAKFVWPESAVAFGGARVDSEGVFRFDLLGDPGRSYEVQASGDLRTWTRLTIVTNSAGVLPLSDSGAATSAQRFYRAKLFNP